MRVNLEFEDKNLFITDETWNDLTKERSVVAFSSVISTAVDTIKRNGAFMIYKDNGEIKRRFDRLHEFEEFVTETNDQRKQKGLDTINR